MAKFKFNGSNVGGICSVYEIPETCITRIETDYLTGKNTLVLNNRDKVLEIYFTQETAKADEENTKSNQGDKFATKITGTIPGVKESNQRLVDYLTNGYHHLVYIDNNGEVRFRKNLTCKISAGTGDSISGLNAFSFEASGTFREPSMYLTDEIISLVGS